MSSISEKLYIAKQEIAKEGIFEAALQVMSNPDFIGLKMQDIAIAAGISTGSLYNYFDNKEELLCYVDRRLHDIILTVVEDVIEGKESPDVKLSGIIDVIFDYVGQYHAVFDLAERSGVTERRPTRDKEALLGRMHGNFEKVLDEGIQKGCFRSVNVKKTAMVLFVSLIGIFEKHKFLKNYIYSKSKAELLEFFTDYLKPV